MQLYRCVFFFNDTATTEIYTLSLHDALPIWPMPLEAPRMTTTEPFSFSAIGCLLVLRDGHPAGDAVDGAGDRKSTRLNSSHANISYAVFCLKKKKKASPRLCSRLLSTTTRST